ncbi:MAG: tyrosine recombinase XerC [Dysgonomonas sp.]
MALIDKYIKYLRYEKNYSLHTEISYSIDLRQFSDFLINNYPDVSLEVVDGDIVRQWVVSLMESKVSPRSVNRKLSTLKSFYKYLLRIGEVASNPLNKIVGPKITKPLPVFVSGVDLDNILDGMESDNSFESTRNRLILELFYVTGMRRAELIGLKDVDVDFFSGTVLVTGKRNKQRIIPVSNDVKAALAKYINLRNDEIANLSGFLFVKEDGQPIYPMLAHRIVSSSLQQISTLAKTSPHVLRHSFATGMLNNGADINAVKELLGHSSLAATEIYTHTSFEELKNIYNKAHPRA